MKSYSISLFVHFMLRLCLSISDFHPDSWNPVSFSQLLLLFLNITSLYWIYQQAWSVSTILTGLLSFMVNYCLTLLLECINSYFENPFCYSWKRVLLWEALKPLTMKRDVLLSKVWNSILEIKFSMNYFQILQWLKKYPNSAISSSPNKLLILHRKSKKSLS